MINAKVVPIFNYFYFTARIYKHLNAQNDEDI